jgi:chemotaxis protein histidine kinase CheA
LLQTWSSRPPACIAEDILSIRNKQNLKVQMRYLLVIWISLTALSDGAPSHRSSLVQLETASSLSLARGRWNQWVFDKANARLLLLFKGTAEGVKVWTNGLDLAVGPPDQPGLQKLPSLPLADAASLKLAAQREELAREEEARREEELKHAREAQARREEELKHAQRKLPSLPVAPPAKDPKQDVAVAAKVKSVPPKIRMPVIHQPAKLAAQPEAAPQPPPPPVAAPVAPHVAAAPVSPHAPVVATHSHAESLPAQKVAAPAQPSSQLHTASYRQPATVPSVKVAPATSQDPAPDPNVSPWTEVVYHAFKKDAGGDKAHLKKLLMEWLQHESDFNTRTWVSQKVEQLEKHVSLGLIQNGAARNGAGVGVRRMIRNGAGVRARVHSRTHRRMVRNGAGVRSRIHARNGAKGTDALSYSFGGLSAAEWAQSLDNDSDSPPVPAPRKPAVVQRRRWHTMSESRRKKMVDRLLQFAKGSKFLEPKQSGKKDVKRTVSHVLSAAAAMQSSDTPKAPLQQVSLAQNAQDAAKVAAEQKTEAAAHAKAAAELAQKQAAEAVAAQQAQIQAAKAAAAESAAAAEAAKKAQAEAEAAAAAERAQAKAAEIAAKQKAAEAAATQKAQQAAAAAAAAQKAAQEAVAQQHAAEAAAAAATKKAAKEAAEQKKQLYKQLKKLLAHGKESWIQQAVQSATSLAEAKRKYNALLLQAQMDAAKQFQLEASNSLTVKVSNEELRTLSFNGELIGSEAYDGGLGPVTAPGSWHIALPQVKEETDAGTMTLAPDASQMVFVMLGGGRYSAVLPLRPGAGRKLTESRWREIKDAPGLETLPEGGVVAAPLKGVGQFWNSWKKKKAALAKKKAATLKKKKAFKDSHGAHHRMQQMTPLNPLAMAGPQAPSTPKQVQNVMPQPMAQTMLPQPMQAPGPAANPIDSAILAVAQSQTLAPPAPVAQQVAQAPVRQAPRVEVTRTTPLPPALQVSPYSAPVSAVDDVITAAALSNSKLPSSWTSSVHA